jgi:hypothetical protein
MGSEKATVRPIFCKERQASELFGLSAIYLKGWREQGRLVEGKHFIRVSERKLLYHVAEMECFLKENTLGLVEAGK